MTVSYDATVYLDGSVAAEVKHFELIGSREESSIAKMLFLRLETVLTVNGLAHKRERREKKRAHGNH